jgi:hypothetical protein
MIGGALLARFAPHMAIGLLAIGLIFGAYQTGVNAERKRGEAASLRVEIETLRRDKDIADRALVRVADDVAELAAAKEQNEEQINALREIIADRADPGLTQSELDGLLNIR